MKYKNYIFDLYGTLVDIRTDEDRPEVWDIVLRILQGNLRSGRTAAQLL